MSLARKHLLTNSRAKCSRLCARKHDLRFLRGWRSVDDADALVFGAVFHQALEAWWRNRGPSALDAALSVVQASALEDFAKARALVMMTGYSLRWSDAPLVAVCVEQEFRTTLNNPDTGAESRVWELAGKIDLIVRDERDGSLWLMEHKTSGEDVSPGSIYSRRLRIDSQISIYYDGAAALGFNLAGCIYDVACKPAQKPLKATPLEARKFKAGGKLYANQRENDETVEEYTQRIAEAVNAEPEQYFARLDVPRLESELTEARRDLWVTAQRMRDDERLGRHPRNPEACTGFGRVCEFFDVCTGVDTLEGGKFVASNPFPELTGAGASPVSVAKEEQQSS